MARIIWNEDEYNKSKGAKKRVRVGEFTFIENTRITHSIGSILLCDPDKIPAGITRVGNQAEKMGLVEVERLRGEILWKLTPQGQKIKEVLLSMVAMV